MAHLVNEPISYAFVMRDNGNTAITGLTSSSFSVREAYETATPGTTATVTIAEIGLGEYRATFTPTTGDTNWVIHLYYNSGGVTREFLESYFVEADDTSDPVATVVPASGATRKELRRLIGRRLGDMVILTETTGGQDTIWRDTSNLFGATNAYRGRYLYPTTGTASNLYELRKITSSTQNQVEFTPALPAVNTIGDEAELWSVHGEGFIPTEVNDIIAEVVNDGNTNFRVVVQASVTDAFDSYDRQFTLPAAITKGIIDVEYEDYDGAWHSIDRASSSGDSGYWVNRGLGYVTIGGDYWLSRMDGLSLRVTGYGIPAPLDDDTDRTDINPEWIVWESMARLLYMGFERNPEVSRLKLPMATIKAEQYRQFARSRGAPDWQRV